MVGRLHRSRGDSTPMATTMAHEGSTKRTWLRKGVVAGSMALGVSSVLGGGYASPAGAAAPTAISSCTGDSVSPTLTAFVSSFPPSETFRWFGWVRQPDGTTFRYNGFTITTDSNGVGGVGLSATYSGLPLNVVFAVYRDTNGNARWDPSSDDTVYEGAGTVTECPQDVTLAPK